MTRFVLYTYFYLQRRRVQTQTNNKYFIHNYIDHNYTQFVQYRARLPPSLSNEWHDEWHYNVQRMFAYLQYNVSLAVVRSCSQTMMSVSQGRDTVEQYVTFGVEGR